MPDGKPFAYNQQRPRANPGPFRAITNQNKTFKGVIAHTGKNGNPNDGFFHRAAEDPIPNEKNASLDDNGHGKGKQGRREKPRRDR